MRKTFGNAAVFAAVMLFLWFGLSGNWFQTVLQELREGASGRITEMVEKTLERELRYHDQMISWNSAKENLLGTRIVEKQDTRVIKADSGKLVGNTRELPFTEEEIRETVEDVELLRKAAEQVGADFLYCMVPAKSTYETLPVNVRDFSTENQERALRALKEEGIPVLDLKTALREKNQADEEIFFVTDHHWKPHSGFVACQAICEELQKRYGFDYHREYTESSNYDVKTYPDWFLGSYGKKVGLYFTWSGADDFDVITPKFLTSFTEWIPSEKTVRQGSFSDTMLHMEHMDKNYYGENPYTTYSGGDYRLQIIRNKLLPDGPRIAVVRSSYACVVTPFLALQAGELHVIDDREGDYPPGDPVDLGSYFQDIQPDYVIVIKQP